LVGVCGKGGVRVEVVGVPEKELRGRALRAEGEGAEGVHDEVHPEHHHLFSRRDKGGLVDGAGGRRTWVIRSQGKGG
jgi:hypothetical protein